jgi:hypothetical protein
MEHCTGKWGQYRNSTGITENCAQAIKQVVGNLSPAGLSSVLDAVREATDAIQILTGEQKLIFEARYWDYLDRHRPQQAQMAHALVQALVVDGKKEYGFR